MKIELKPEFLKKMEGLGLTENEKAKLFPYVVHALEFLQVAGLAHELDLKSKYAKEAMQTAIEALQMVDPPSDETW